MSNDPGNLTRSGNAAGKTNSSTAPGIYIHVPFCRRKCRYCDFYSITGTERIPAFVTALVREIGQPPIPATVPDSLYVGGGTPSLLLPQQMETIISAVRDRFDLASHSEISIEVNPGTVTLEKFRAYASMGCNRVSMGIQSFNDRQLAFLGRIHSAGEALDAVDLARSAGFTNLGIDLIYGLPGQTVAMWTADLQKAVELQPEHLSCYLLGIEPRTPMFRDLKAGRFNPLDDRECADLFRLTHQYLCARGYDHYEISNFARTPALRSRHNQKYWHFNSTTGLGPSAHSYDHPSKTRWWNHTHLNRYLNLTLQGHRPVAGEERLSAVQQMMESVYCGLRTTDGIDISTFNRRFDMDFERHFEPILHGLTERGWIDASAGRCRPTPEGMLFLDRMAEELIDLVSESLFADFS